MSWKRCISVIPIPVLKPALKKEIKELNSHDKATVWFNRESILVSPKWH